MECCAPTAGTQRATLPQHLHGYRGLTATVCSTGDLTQSHSISSLWMGVGVGALQSGRGAHR